MWVISVFHAGSLLTRSTVLYEQSEPEHLIPFIIQILNSTIE